MESSFEIERDTILYYGEWQTSFIGYFIFFLNSHNMGFMAYIVTYSVDDGFRKIWMFKTSIMINLVIGYRDCSNRKSDKLRNLVSNTKVVILRVNMWRNYCYNSEIDGTIKLNPLKKYLLKDYNEIFSCLSIFVPFFSLHS